MDAFATWLQATALSQLIVSNTWIWPAAETLHFIGLALLLGIVGVLDLRLIGFLRQVPIAAIRELVPFAMAGFAVNAVTGAIFLVGHPEQYIHNVAWWFKVGSLALAGLNAAFFEVAVWPRTQALTEAQEDTPLEAKAIGVVSIVAWLGVLYWGRMLPFIGDAF
jgi:hypothetical protein